jgi:flavin reductase (DIM6/NTAB) family NADH-FMN oxidoreductase RutF
MASQSIAEVDTVGFDPDRLDAAEQYKLLGGAVAPRPIGLITTLGTLGSNAAPFSYFMAVAQNPPMLMFSIGMKEKEGDFSMGATQEGEKDTLLNLRELPEFVAHIVDEATVERMNICAIQFPRGVNEIERAGFRSAPSKKIRPPRIIDCPVQLECKVHQIIVLGRTPYHMVIGEVVYMHFAKGLVNERLHVDWRRLAPIARLARPSVFVRIGDNFSLPVPKDLVQAKEE